MILGQGAHGTVRRNPGLTVTKTFSESDVYRHEVGILSKLRRVPHIAQMIDDNVGCDSILLEDGGGTLLDLRDAVLDQWNHIMQQVAVATAFLHGRLIVHGDIKMENILVDHFYHVRLCDFGHARVVHPHEADKVVLSEPRGSPSYMCPEMVNGNRYNGFDADAWSLGVVLFAFVMSYFPFALARVGDRNYDTFVRHVERGQNPTDALLVMWSGSIAGMKNRATSVFSSNLDRLLQPEASKRCRLRL
jgi:serine/threonine protein kinase